MIDMQQATTGVTTKPDTIADALARIEQRLSHLERMVTRADNAFEQLPQLLAVVTDTLDQHILAAEDAGFDPGQRAAALLKIAERLTTPAALGLAETLVTHLPSLQRLLDAELLSSGGSCIVRYEVPAGRSGGAKLRATVFNAAGTVITEDVGGELTGSTLQLTVRWAADKGATRLYLRPTSGSAYCQPYTIRCDPTPGASLSL